MGKLVIVDVRTPEEWTLVHVAGSTLLPLNRVEKDFDEVEVPPGVAVATLCHHGVRSLKGDAGTAGQRAAGAWRP